MKRHTKGPVYDISIRGDELEHHRIQLEHNLQRTDLSLRLSSASDNEGFNEEDTIEYARHNSGPPTFPDFASLEQRSRDHFDGDTHSQIHPWSYHTVDDEEGINPYGGETMSTAAHHASALTLNAGLGGGRGARRDVSLSGAEYDPDRPLRDMIAGVDSKLSVFDVEASRSKYPGIGSVTFDPLVVDSTAELDRILRSGYAPAPPASLHSPLHSSSSSSASESDHNLSPRPKLSDALRRVSFSPKRPRSVQSNRSDSRNQPALSPLAHTSPLPNTSHNAPTPRPAKRTNIFPSYPASPATQPQVRLQPPTPTSTSSKFGRMARGITREIEEQQQQEHIEQSRPASAPAGERNPFDTTSASARQPTPRRASAMKQQTPRGKIQLPDVTGLTSAVESPAKLGTEYYPYRAGDGPRESEARLLKTLSVVQAQLHHLEQENSISRRRVRELELELEVCKRDVARERTRVMEREEVIVQQQRDVSIAQSRKNKGKARAKDASMDADAAYEKYREAVEEKKALEALISTLRTHLTRLTSELSSHQELLTELRTLRDSDVRALKQKSGEVDRLKEEVERLAGEVEVLRGVVEEGLKERRSVRDVSVVHSTADLAMSEDMESEEDEDELEAEPQHEQSRHHTAREASEHQDTDNEEEDEEPEPFDPMSILGSSRGNVNFADRTMRTDHATLGSSKLGTSTTTGQFIDSAEFERISAEVEERRLERSGLARSQNQSRSRLHSRSPSPTERRSRRATVEDDSDQEIRPASPALSTLSSRRAHQRVAVASAPMPAHEPQPSSSRPTEPTPAPTTRSHPRRPKPREPEETPFPQIRGTHLERLFFSAPEHDAKTCTVCHRRRREPDASWIPSRFGEKGRREERRDHEHDEDDSEEEEDEDEGFAEGSEGTEHEQALQDHKGKQREHVTFSTEPGPWRQQARREGLPPQTVIARVIRELEDDFTHYKSIYVELADQYKEMDAVSDVRRRNTLAQHLREVVDILEQKGDQIASLYDLLSFKDKPVSESIVPSKTRTPPAATSSWGRSGGMKKHAVALT